MALKLALYARELADARKRGKRPAHLVLIADGEYPLHRYYHDNCVLRVLASDDPKSYDWWPVMGCDIEVCTEGSASRTIRWANALLPFARVWLSFWFMDNGRRLSIRRVGVNSGVLPEPTEIPPWGLPVGTPIDRREIPTGLHA